MIRQAINAQYPIVISGNDCFNDTASFYVNDTTIEGMNYHWCVPEGLLSEDTTKGFIKTRRDTSHENKNRNLKFTASLCGGTKDTIIEIKARITRPKIILADTCIPTIVLIINLYIVAYLYRLFWIRLFAKINQGGY